MNEILSLQNYFSIPLELYFKKQRKYQTTVGIVSSLLINLIVIAFVIVLLTELISRNNPNVNNIFVTNKIGANLTVNSDDLIIAINVVDQFFKPINDPTVLRIEFNYDVRVGHDGVVISRSTPMTVINCTEFNYKKYKQHGLEREFLANHLFDYYCFNGTEIDDEIVLGGYFGYDFYGYIAVDVYKCINETVPGVVCKPNEEIDRLLDGAWFEAFFIDHYVDIYDFASPIQAFSNNVYSKIDPNFMKVMYSYFSKIDVNSNNNVLLNSYSKTSTFGFEKINNDIISIQKNQLIAFSIISSLTTEINNRYYIQLTTIAGNALGILNGLKIFGSILLYFVNQISYKSSLFNSIFEFYNIKARRLNAIYSNGSLHPIMDKKGRYIVKLNLSLKKIIRMNLCCANKRNRKEMRQEYKRLDNIVMKYVDYVALIKNGNVLTLMKDKLMCYMKEDTKESKESDINLIDKIELNVYKEQLKFDSQIALRSSKYSFTCNQFKVNDSSLQKIKEDKYNNNYLT